MMRIAGYAAVAIGLAVVLYVLMFPGASCEELEADAAPFIAIVEDFRTRTGAYPTDLTAARIELPDTRAYGGWCYDCSARGEWFTLTIGDYGEYLFLMVWDSREGEWWVDA